MAAKLTAEEQKQKKAEEAAQQKAEALTASGKYGKVFPLGFIDEDTKEYVVGFIQAPNRLTKLRVLDMQLNMGHGQAGNMLMEACFVASGLNKESDPRIELEDKYWIGACLASLRTIEASIEQFKKK